MSTTHYYGDDCIPPHEKYEPSAAAKEEFFAKLHDIEAQVAAAAGAQAPEAPAELVEEASEAFDAFCQSRHEMGAEKYGPVKFMTANTLEEAMAEIVDLSNYARYTFIKVYLLNRALSRLIPESLQAPNSFVPNSREHP